MKYLRTSSLIYLLVYIFYFYRFFNDCSVTLASLPPWLIQRKVMSSYDVNTKTVGVSALKQTNDIAC
jgi:hypothetical protein